MPTADSRVTLFTRQGCHLCESARAVLREVCGDDWHEVDVDLPDALTGDGRPAGSAYGELLPVLEVDGRRAGYWQIDTDLLVAALQRSSKP
ncbi:glutaredoxin family protein [Cellulomonas sp. NPDC089187]|uniref:glutaredoxin family protein n=1 Tax=Cellulomonas sp. NPDC089187 TaxID=3154970 RepID=UPI00343C9D7D